MNPNEPVGADEARRQFRDLLDEVAKGARVTVERYGKPVALVVPPGWGEQGGNPDWRRIAEMLAGRLVSHAFCDAHGEGKPDPDCPFCEDRDAYRRYLKAGGPDMAMPVPPGRSVPLHEVPLSDHFVYKTGQEGQ